MTITASSVKLLLGNEEYADIADSEFDPHIAAAELVVSEDLVDSGLSVDRKQMIGTFLAAHFALLTFERGGLIRERVGDSSSAYKPGSESDRGFALTRFGQNAIALDTSGTLALRANTTQRAEFRVV